MGGHAPIVGAEVYVLQAGTGGYDSAPTNTFSTTGGVGKDPTYGRYSLTQPDGSFSVTGDYTCTATHPVYVAAVGGTASTTATLVTITSVSSTATTITFKTTAPPAAGSSISFASGAFSSAAFTFLNGNTYLVSSVVAGTSFSIASTANPGPLTATTYALAGGLPNPAIVNIAVLGNCPSSGNFSTSGNGALSFVWVDEVSTTAAAYALNAFGNDWHAIGAKNNATSLAAIQQAALNAGQLYNIQDNNSANRGEALALTPSVSVGGVQVGNNGVVPQATLNTIGNILSSCVDSANTSSSKSDQCNTLFTTATASGDKGGANPTEITGAAFNLASYPGGTGTQSGTLPAILYALQGSSATPYVPDLSGPPNDFGVAIVYDDSHNTHVGSAESVAIDGNGQIWTTAQSDTSATLWSPQGTVVASNSSGYIYGYVSIDPSNNAWTGSANASTGIETFDNLGVQTNTFGGGFQSAYTVITNQSANAATSIDAYFFAGATAQDGYWYTPNGDTGNTGIFGGGNGPGPAGGYAVSNNFIAHGALDSAGDLWLTSEAGRQIERVTPNTGNFYGIGNSFNVDSQFATPTVTGATYQPQPEFPAIDSANNAWVPLQSTYSQTGSSTLEPGLYKVSTGGGTPVAYYSGTGTNTGTKIYTGAAFYQAFGSAVDGNGNIWITNRYNPGLGGNSAAPGANTIIELTKAGVAVSPSTNYTYGGILDDPLNLAIDPSGNIWVTNYGGSKLVEIIGAAGPVVTPLSTSANNGTLGTLP